MRATRPALCLIMLATACSDKPSAGSSDEKPVAAADRCEEARKTVPEMPPGWKNVRWGNKVDTLMALEPGSRPTGGLWIRDSFAGRPVDVGFFLDSRANKGTLRRVELQLPKRATDAELEADFKAASEALRADLGAPVVEQKALRLERWVGGTCGEKHTQVTHQIITTDSGVTHRVLYDDLVRLEQSPRPGFRGR